MKAIVVCAVSAVLLGLPFLGAAAIAQRPGLWTVSVSFTQGLPELDPELIEQMRMMGLEVPDREAQVQTQDVCLTPDQVKRDRLPDIHDPGTGCTARNLVRVGDRATGTVECDGHLRGNGRAQVTLGDPHNFSGNATFQGQTVEGFPLFINGVLSGRWKSDDCGSVEPYDV
jgi:hypothetical protein